jgi:hypothetical protein
MIKKISKFYFYVTTFLSHSKSSIITGVILFLFIFMVKNKDKEIKKKKRDETYCFEDEQIEKGLI